MTKVNISLLDGDGLFIIQIVLLVLYYGNILPMLPLWVVWAPAILYIALLAIVLVCGFIALLAVSLR
jgi:hypothetical protein